eukprot:184218_1
MPGIKKKKKKKIETVENKIERVIKIETLEHVLCSSKASYGPGSVEIKTLEHELCSSIDECEYTKRIVSILSKYQSLNTDDKAVLVALCTDQYGSLLNDYIHVLDVHNSENDLDEIFNSMIT